VSQLRRFGMPRTGPRTSAAVLFVSALISQSACVSARVAAVPPQPAQDSVYAPVLERWTRKTHVFSQFQNKIEISGVLLTDQMRKAVGERLARLRGGTEGMSVLSDSSGGNRLGLLVSVYTPESAYLNFDDKSLWSLSLRVGPTQQAPVFVRRVFDKTTLEPFFSNIHLWSQDYLLVFDFPENAVSQDSKSDTPLSEAEFSAQSALARVALRWP
jgi:hypothetical protein